ncbi:MAG: hypothetical protein ABI461_08755 [Polyangiaceae bacterium]
MRKGRAWLVVSLLSMVIAVVACSSAPTEQCDCTDPNIRIHVPPDLAAAAMTPILAKTCAGAALTCTQQGATGGCETFEFAPAASGECDISVNFSNGKVFYATLDISESTGCCAGFHTQPFSAADVQIPEGT